MKSYCRAGDASGPQEGERLRPGQLEQVPLRSGEAYWDGKGHLMPLDVDRFRE